MSIPLSGAAQKAVSDWPRMRVWATAHAVDDFYQGLIPAAAPYFVLARDYSYLGASGLAMAATVGSALPQLFVGLLVDRHRVAWLAPWGLGIAGVGLAWQVSRQRIHLCLRWCSSQV